MTAARSRPSRTERVIRALLRVFPIDFRADHGVALEQTLRAQYRDARDLGGPRALLRLWLEIAGDLVTTAPGEHLAIVRQDLSHTLRGLRRAPVFAASAVLTLALGMSAATGMVAIVNAVMFRPLTVERPREIISISNRTGPMWVSYADLQDFRTTPLLADAAGFAPRPASLNVGGEAERITIDLVTDNYFSMLGVTAAAGRLIQPERDRPWIDDAVLVLSYDYWRGRFGGDPAVIGRSVRVNGATFTIIGVASSRFRGTEPLVRAAAYVPASAADAFSERPRGTVFEDRAWRTFAVLARLAPGATIEQARAALEVKAAALAREFPSTNKDVSLRIVPETHTRPTPQLGPFLRVASTALAGLSAIVLLITSANLANLLMARAATRNREMALRAALGARRGRIVRQLLTEGVVVSVLGGLVAIPIVALAINRLRAFISGASAVATFDPDFSLDAGVLTVTMAIAVGAGIVAGLAPAMWVLRSDAATDLRSTSRGVTHRAGGAVRGTLVVVQVALSLTLLVTGGLFVRSLDRAKDVDLGFEPDGLVLASASPGLQAYDAAKRLAFYERVRDRLGALPGVEAAAWIQFPPLGVIGDESAEVAPEPRPVDPAWRPPVATEVVVSPEYFTTARVALVEGRAFNRGDAAGTVPVVIVNETLARRFWPNQSPVGRHLTADGVRLEVIGVVRNGKYQNISEDPRPAIFTPLERTVPGTASIAVRTSRPLEDVAPEIRRAFRAVDPDVVVFDVRTMATHLDNGAAFFPFRLAAFMTSLFGGMGVLLAGIGLYGMVAFQVGRRTQEIGVRMALGASAAVIIRDVLVQGGRSALIGIAIGVVLSTGLAQLLKGLLFGVNPFDPLTYLMVAVFLAAICLVASLVPARRALAVDPLIALRAD
jgi:putative ABC transport system permease protein